MLLSVLVVVLLAAVAVAVAVAFSVVPFVMATDLAERRGFSAGRWGGTQLVLLAISALATLVGARHGHLVLLVVPAALLCWITPAVLSLLSPDEQALGGYQGAHEA